MIIWATLVKFVAVDKYPGATAFLPGTLSGLLVCYDSTVEILNGNFVQYPTCFTKTRAFHGLGDKRPIITNIFGTAHTQWGNLLVPLAAFRDPVLHSYVDEELLQTLFHKTIKFLRQPATATSALRTDMRILEGLQKDLFSYYPSTN
ncbi:unnamed protein product, partial [Fusarium langsethiae]